MTSMKANGHLAEGEAPRCRRSIVAEWLRSVGDNSDSDSDSDGELVIARTNADGHLEGLGVSRVCSASLLRLQDMVLQSR